MYTEKKFKKILRKQRVRAKISGTKERPRLSVFRGLKTCIVQLIDDSARVTIVSATERELSKELQHAKKTERAAGLGTLIAQKAKEKNITEAVFDRGSNKYHGRVKAIADAARHGGLQF